MSTSTATKSTEYDFTLLSLPPDNCVDVDFFSDIIDVCIFAYLNSVSFRIVIYATELINLVEKNSQLTNEVGIMLRAAHVLKDIYEEVIVEKSIPLTHHYFRLYKRVSSYYGWQISDTDDTYFPEDLPFVIDP
jgi:hypothetical protein